MKVLVTGGAGFVGSNLIRHIISRPEIERLINVDCLTYAGHLENLKDVEEHSKYVFEPIDIRNREAVRKVLLRHDISHVVHLAAESHVDRSISGPGNFIETNVLGTFHLLEACRAFWNGNWEGKRFHHVSTDEVYGSLGETGYFSESTPCAPRSPYASSKASSDMLVSAWHHTYKLPVVITRSSNNYGPYQFPEKLIPMVVQSALNRRPIPVFGDGLNVRDWLFVRDHAEALWEALTRGTDGETYNIGANNERSNLDLVQSICDICDELAPGLGGGSRKLITFVKDRPGHDRRYAIDASKIRKELGWEPAHAFDLGLRETIRWYLDNQDWVNCVCH